MKSSARRWRAASECPLLAADYRCCWPLMLLATGCWLPHLSQVLASSCQSSPALPAPATSTSTSPDRDTIADLPRPAPAAAPTAASCLPPVPLPSAAGCWPAPPPTLLWTTLWSGWRGRTGRWRWCGWGTPRACCPRWGRLGGCPRIAGASVHAGSLAPCFLLPPWLPHMLGWPKGRPALPPAAGTHEAYN